MNIKTFPARKRTITSFYLKEIKNRGNNGVFIQEYFYEKGSFYIDFPKSHFIKETGDLYLFFEIDNDIFVPVMSNVFAGYVCLPVTDSLEEAIDLFWKTPFDGKAYLDTRERFDFADQLHQGKVEYISINECRETCWDKMSSEHVTNFEYIVATLRNKIK